MSAGEAISLGDKRHQRSQRDCSTSEENNLLQCLIGVLLRIAVMWWICLSVYLYTTQLSLGIKQPFRENTTGQVGTDSIQATVFHMQEGALMETVNSNDRSVIIFIDLVITSPLNQRIQPGNLCYMAVFWLSAARIFHSVAIVVFLRRREGSGSAAKRSAATTISFEIFRSHTLKWLNIIAPCDEKTVAAVYYV